MVTVVWQARLKEGTEVEGLDIVRTIWSELARFDSYVSHRLLIDEDAAGHLLIVSQWASRQAVDELRDRYASSEHVRRLTRLFTRPMESWALREDTALPLEGAHGASRREPQDDSRATPIR